MSAGPLVGSRQVELELARDLDRERLIDRLPVGHCLNRDGV